MGIDWEHGTGTSGHTPTFLGFRSGNQHFRSSECGILQWIFFFWSGRVEL
jgi:hypothetical protein